MNVQTIQPKDGIIVGQTYPIIRTIIDKIR